jgi:2-dehydro-3-deoxyphosphogluconate aldolase / (4S)-4-hydroxy-2-oxoglutarate aldolase
MKKNETLDRIRGHSIVPIIRSDDEKRVFSIVKALCAAGINIVELSLSLPSTLAILERLVKTFRGSLIAGAGTVLDARTAASAISAGARFIVSPDTDESVISTCKRHSIVACPGALTPGEVVRAWRAGADFVKVFPCNALGGPAYIRSLKAPLPQVAMIPCGGVTLDTAAEYIKAGAASLFVGSGLFSPHGRPPATVATITKTAAKMLSIVKKARSTLT